MLIKRFSFILLLCFGLGLFVHYQSRAPKRNFSDYRVYYDAGKNILLGKDIYVRASEEITPYKYSPSFAVFMVPFSIFDKRVSANLFFLFNLVCLYYSFWLSRKLIFFNNLDFKKTATIMALVLILSFRAILHCLDSGQVGILILSLTLFGLYFIYREKEVRGSFLIGFAGMIKYMPFIFGIFFFLRKKYRIVLFMASSFLTFCLLPAIFIGFKTNFDYLRSWIPYITTTSLDKGSLVDYKNYSLWSLVGRYYATDYFGNLIVVILFIIVVFIFSFDKKAESAEDRQLLVSVDYGIIFLSMALFNPNAWMHNFSVVIFPYMVGVYYLFTCNFKDKLVLLFILLSFVLFSFGSELLVGDKLQNILEEHFLATWGALLILASLIKIKFFSYS